MKEIAIITDDDNQFDAISSSLKEIAIIRRTKNMFVYNIGNGLRDYYQMMRLHKNSGYISPADWYNHKSKTFKKNKRKGL